VRQETLVPDLIQIRDLATRVAALQNKAKQQQVLLPSDVAHYIAQNVRSSPSALEGALLRLMAHSAVSGTEITLKFTQQVLANFIGAEARKVDIDPVQSLLSLPVGAQLAKNGKIKRQLTAEDQHFVFSLLGIRDERKASRVRHQLQVNLREHERERLARRDAYERDLERRAKKRKQG
jgi:Bacterial dnaA  protein